MTPITKEHLVRACAPGCGARTCAFLTMGSEGWECGKESGLEEMIRARIPTMGAKGDNCTGPPSFRLTVVQN